MKSAEYKLILTANGLNTSRGAGVIRRALEQEGLNPGGIFLIVPPAYEIDQDVIRACEALGFSREDIHLSGDCADGRPGEWIEEVKYLYVSEGNTFLIMQYMRTYGFDMLVRDRVLSGKSCYLGASAGAMIASGLDFRLARYFDPNDYIQWDFGALGLMPDTDTILPHYEEEQLHRFIAEMEGPELSRYSRIHSVADGEALILDCRRDAEKVELLREQKIKRN